MFPLTGVSCLPSHAGWLITPTADLLQRALIFLPQARLHFPVSADSLWPLSITPHLAPDLGTICPRTPHNELLPPQHHISQGHRDT